MCRPRTPVPFAQQAQVLCVWGLDLLHLAMYAYTSTSPSCFAFAIIQFMSCALCAVVYHFAVANHADFFGQAKFPWYVAQSALLCTLFYCGDDVWVSCGCLSGRPL